jgi:hypothetical protein
MKGHGDQTLGVRFNPFVNIQAVVFDSNPIIVGLWVSGNSGLDGLDFLRAIAATGGL